MSSIIAFEPYVVRTGRGDPFVQSGVYRKRVNWGVLFGPDFGMSKQRGVGRVTFTQ
jgi:hypothetical protein